MYVQKLYVPHLYDACSTVHSPSIVCSLTYLDFENPDLAQRQKRAETAGGQQQLILQLLY